MNLLYGDTSHLGRTQEASYRWGLEEIDRGFVVPQQLALITSTGCLLSIQAVQPNI